MIQIAPIRQAVAAEQIEDVTGAVQAGLAEISLKNLVQPGMRVALAVGSRGISCYREVVTTVVRELLALGARPFLVPAMGSHGGGTAEGQRRVLEAYGLGERDLGVPVLSSLETVQIGETPEGMPVYLDAYAAQADAIIPINRIKAHTAFHHRWESGLFKILAVGLGKEKGAKTIHAWGIHTAMPAAARVIIQKMPVIAGIGIVENGRHLPARIAVLPAADIENEEPRLLELAKALMPGIPLEPLDLLVIQEIGKDISGTGMDVNVVGMWRRNGGPVQPEFRVLAALDLTENSHGNAIGVGYADLITRRLRDKIDLEATAVNCLTSGNFNGGKIPITLATDREVIMAGLQNRDPATARVVIIHNTLDLEIFWASAALLPEVSRQPNLTQIGPLRPLSFDESGALDQRSLVLDGEIG
jgi:hypothetical protein